jgi:hypothetical protein
MNGTAKMKENQKTTINLFICNYLYYNKLGPSGRIDQFCKNKPLYDTIAAWNNRYSRKNHYVY